MIEINKTVIGIAAGVAGTLFIGYCIYFDNKRRTDPDYKKKVHERRRKNRKTGATGRSGIPNLDDPKAIERYFIQEIQLGESLITRGEYESGIQHLANAIVVCGEPTKLLQVLQTSLPSQVFAMLIMKMQEFGNSAHAGGGHGDEGNKSSHGSASLGGLDGSAAGGIIIDDLE